MDGVKLVAVDTETTGISPGKGDRICEIGLISFGLDGVYERFGSIINPKRDIPYHASRVHGIDNRTATKAPTFADISGHITDRLSGAIVVAHNANFDIRFLQAEFNRLGLRSHVPFLCSCNTARRLLPGPRNYQLGTLASYLDLPKFAKHTAVDDAEACARVMIRLIEDNPSLQLRIEEQAAKDRTIFHGETRSLPRGRTLRR